MNREQIEEWIARPNHALNNMNIDEFRTLCQLALRNLKAGFSVSEAGEPDLDAIERYRMQMAGISTAAIGYWKEGDSIHPDYDTLALRDVAKLYAKYDALYQEKHAAPSGMVAVPPNKCTRTAPECIWLQVSDEAQSLDEPFPASEEGITWCSDSVVDCEVEYVRADLAAPEVKK